MRDAMYRNCEGYFSGALSRSQFDQALTRFQILMSGLLAIEQFTGAVVAPPATGSPQSKIAVLKLTEAQEKLLLALKEDKMMLEDNRKIAAEKSASTKVAEIDKRIEAKNKEINRMTANINFLRTERERVLLGSLVSDVSNENQWRASEGSVKTIAEAVTTIAKETLKNIGAHNKFLTCARAFQEGKDIDAYKSSEAGKERALKERIDTLKSAQNVFMQNGVSDTSQFFSVNQIRTITDSISVLIPALVGLKQGIPQSRLVDNLTQPERKQNSDELEKEIRELKMKGNVRKEKFEQEVKKRTSNLDLLVKVCEKYL